MNSFTEKTLVPISLVIVIGGFIYWAAQIDANVRAHEARIEKVYNKADLQMEVLSEVRSDVAYIKHVIEEKKK